MGIGLEAAGGLSAVQALLRQRFDDQIAAQERNQRAMESDREFGLKSQEANLRGQAFKQQSADRADALAQRVQGERDTAALKAAPSVGMGNSIDQPQYAKTFAGTAAESQFQPQMTLPATQMSGTGDPGSMQAQPAPQTPTGRQTFLGTPQQRQEAQDSSALDALASDPSTPAPVRGFLRVRKVIPKGESVPAQLFETKPEHVGEVKETPQGFVRIGTDNSVTPITSGGKQVTGRHEAPTVTIQTVDDKGNPVTRVVSKADALGKDFAAKPNAVTANRADSALAVKQTGEDIIAKLSDPKIASMVGPAMGRANSLRDFIGNPPPELSELAGNIESYALASMGVHGMRNAQGAQKINDMLSAKHTPESLMGTIRGLNNFSQHFLENQGRGGATSGGTVKMRAPNGQEKDVSPSEVEHYKAQGAVVVK